jgi:lipoate-protein ligase A
MLYKDDTIFQHISFFQDVDLDALAQAAKVTKKKDVFQARSLLARPVEISDEEEEESKNYKM